MSLHEPPTRAPGTDGDREDQTGDRSRVIVGQVVSGPAYPGPEDHLPGPQDWSLDSLGGTVEKTRETGVRTAAGAAFIAARNLGVATLWTSRGAWTVLRYFGHGVRGTSVLAWRYVRAYDARDDYAEEKGKTRRKKVAEERRDRWKVVGIWAGVLAAVDLGAWKGMTAWAHLPALTWEAWGAAPALEVSTALAAVTLYGRYRVQRELAAGEFLSAEDAALLSAPEEDDTEPFPLEMCTTAGHAVNCLDRALMAERLGARSIQVLKRYPWGWEFEVVLSRTTPAKVSAATDALETHMDLPVNGFQIEADPRKASRIAVRAVVDDPFADMGVPAVHAPNSLSIYDLVNMGKAMDGGPLEITLDGFFALVVGAMGAGKTLGALRALAEAVTACRDAVAWDLDPAKDGLSEFGDLMEVRARGLVETEEALARLHRYVDARASIFRSELNMGDRWKASPEYPAIFGFVDEAIALTPAAKAHMIHILRVGRQVGIWLIIAGQEATEDALGDAIGAIIAYRILLSCRPEDVRICFGPGRAALGWRPDRLVPATGDLINDAGKSFIMGGRFVRPIQYRFNGYSIDQIKGCTAERLAAGRPVTDAATRRAAGESVTAEGRTVTVPDRLDALHAQGGVHNADVVAELLRVFDAAGEEWLPSATLLEALDGWTAVLAGEERPIDGDVLGRVLRAHAPGAMVSRRRWDGKPQVRGWDREVIDKAASGLLDPSRTRLGGV